MNRLVTLVFISVLAACGGKKESAPAATGSGSGSGSAVAATADAGSAGSADGSAAAAAEPLDVPTAVDFEPLAAEEITDKNLEARVKDLEAELEED